MHIYTRALSSARLKTETSTVRWNQCLRQALLRPLRLAGSNGDSVVCPRCCRVAASRAATARWLMSTAPKDARDIVDFLKGTWKRNLEWRHFGGAFQHTRTSNTIIVVEEVDREGKLLDAPKQSDSRFLNWSFCSTLPKKEEDLVFGYTMEFIPQPSKKLFVQWTHDGHKCTGAFFPDSGVLTLDFQVKPVNVVYRIVDKDVMGVVITEVDGENDPTLQYGNMYRLDEEMYAT